MELNLVWQIGRSAVCPRQITCHECQFLCAAEICRYPEAICLELPSTAGQLMIRAQEEQHDACVSFFCRPLSGWLDFTQVGTTTTIGSFGSAQGSMAAIVFKRTGARQKKTGPPCSRRGALRQPARPSSSVLRQQCTASAVWPPTALRSSASPRLSSSSVPLLQSCQSMADDATPIHPPAARPVVFGGRPLVLARCSRDACRVRLSFRPKNRDGSTGV